MLIILYNRLPADVCQVKGRGNLGNLRLNDVFLELKAVFEGGFKLKDVIKVVDCVGRLCLHPVVPDKEIDDFA
jgi:hypothetical protein